MPPKKGSKKKNKAAAAKGEEKAIAKARAKQAEDLTFGLKNKKKCDIVNLTIRGGVTVYS